MILRHSLYNVILRNEEAGSDEDSFGYTSE
jgi:hypothetical protein